MIIEAITVVSLSPVFESIKVHQYRTLFLVELQPTVDSIGRAVTLLQYGVTSDIGTRAAWLVWKHGDLARPHVDRIASLIKAGPTAWPYAAIFPLHKHVFITIWDILVSIGRPALLPLLTLALDHRRLRVLHLAAICAILEGSADVFKNGGLGWYTDCFIGDIPENPMILRVAVSLAFDENIVVRQRASLLLGGKVIELKTLRYCDLYRKGLTSEGLKELASLRRLQALSLRATPIKDAHIEALKYLNRLERLDLSDDDLTDAGIKHLAAMRRLKHLGLSFTFITNAGLENIARLEDLQELDLSWTRITDSGLSTLTGLKQLRTLDLSHTKVTTAGIEKLQKALPECKIVVRKRRDVD